jgi:hypothetical protein
MISLLAPLPKGEVDEQLRDWALFGTLSKIGVGGQATVTAQPRRAPVRLPYFDEVYVNDYGSGRRAIVDQAGTHILLFVDKAEPRPKVALARLADRVRAETGQKFTTYHVFEIDRANVKDARLRVTRQADLSEPQLFGPDYGYAEMDVSSLQSMKDWLGKIDDLTFVEVRGKSVMFGGRRFSDARERGVTLEDIIVLYRAQRTGVRLDGNPEPGFSLDPTWNIRGLRRDLETLAADPCVGLKTMASEAMSASDEGKRLDRLARTLGPSLVSTLAASTEDPLIAFGLDARAAGGMSQSDCAKVSAALKTQLADIAKDLKAVESNFVGAGRLSQVPSEVRRAEASAGRVQNLYAQAAPGPVGEWVGAAYPLLMARDQPSCARYDGPSQRDRSLEGTRVGMNLFYTDHIAKMWVTDHGRSAPILDVPGFTTLLSLDLDPHWAAEKRARAATRLWFGLREGGLSSNSSGLSFAHVSARVFAAGSGNGFHAAEAQPAEDSRQVFGWFDRNFESIMVHEQEFALLNQVMKWSAVAPWLVKKGLLDFLDNDTPALERGLRFDRWRSTEASSLGLKYANRVDVVPDAAAPKLTECLVASISRDAWTAGYSRRLMGGVSLGSRESVDALPRVSTTGLPSRRFADALSASASKGPGTASRVVHDIASGVDTTRPGLRPLRWGQFELASKSLTTNARRNAAGLEQVIASDGERIGAVSASNAGANDIALGWSEGNLHARARKQMEGKAFSARRSSLGTLATAVDVQGPRPAEKASVKASADASKELSDEGFRALKDVAVPRGRRLFDLAQATTASPEASLGRALCDLEDGLLAKARPTLATASNSEIGRGPLVERLAKDGFTTDESSRLARGQDVFIAGGNVELVSDTGRSEPLLRVKRSTGSTTIVKTDRISLAGDHSNDFRAPGFEVYIDDRFSLNKNDLLNEGESVLGTLMGDPSARWRRIDVPLDDHTPEFVAFTDTEPLRRLPPPRRAREGRSSIGSRRSGIRTVIAVTRCDPKAPPNSPDACDP